MSVIQSLKAFFTSTKSFLSQLRPRSDPTPSSSTSSPSIDDPESQPVSAPNTEQHNPNQFLLQWQNVVMAFCFESALKICLLDDKKESQIPLSFHFFSFIILLVFLSLFVAKFVGQKFTFTSQVLEKVAIRLAATSFVLTITIPFQLKLKCVIWALYAVCLFIVVIVNGF